MAFRGTTRSSLTEWVGNLEFLRTPHPYPGYPESSVHTGFLHAYQIHKDELIPAISKLARIYPDYSIWITGHSLGAALATLLALDLVYISQLSPVFLITFGSPRVGNSVFAQAFNNSAIRNFRVVGGSDIVPHLPPSLIGFQHVPEEIWQVSVDNYSNIRQCDFSGEDETCSRSVGLLTSISDHFNYFKQLVDPNGPCSGNEDWALKLESGRSSDQKQSYIELWKTKWVSESNENGEEVPTEKVTQILWNSKFAPDA